MVMFGWIDQEWTRGLVLRIEIESIQLITAEEENNIYFA